MKYDNNIILGIGKNGPAYLNSNIITRHGLISGTTGSGKTICLKLIAEGLSSLGIPVLVTDIKGDLGSMALPGKQTDTVCKRLIKCGINPETYVYRAFPTFFWDIWGKNGHPVRTAVDSIDPLLMARLLGLNEIQTQVLEVVYRISRNERFRLEDLKDLHTFLLYVGENASKYFFEYGYFAPQTVSIIQRQVYQLEDMGAGSFFGSPGINILDWFIIDVNNTGIINILSAEHLIQNPYLYSTLLLWILSAFSRILPDRGESCKPVLAILIDEADLLFKGCSARLMGKIEQMLRLMRSKGIAVFMQTWNPAEIPTPIARQLHNRILFSMNAFSPQERQIIRTITDSFPISPYFDVFTEINKLGTGEAIVNLLREDGTPGITDRITVLPPQSSIGLLPNEIRKQKINSSPFLGKYDELIDRYSAYEQLSRRK